MWGGDVSNMIEKTEIIKRMKLRAGLAVLFVAEELGLLGLMIAFPEYSSKMQSAVLLALLGAVSAAALNAHDLSKVRNG